MPFTTMIDEIPPLAVKLISSGLVVVIGLAAIFICQKVIKAYTKRRKKSSSRNYETVSTVLSSLVKYAGYFLIICQVLSIFGASMESILAVAGIGSIAIGFGARGIAEDFITGSSILFENQFAVGDTIELNGKTGTVESIGLRVTTIRSLSGDVHIFPNSTIKLVTNMSKSFNRAVVHVYVPYEERVSRVLSILTDEMSRAREGSGAMLADPSVEGIVEMNEQCLVIRIIVDCEVGKNWAVERYLRQLVKTRLETEQIPPPYPRRFLYPEPGPEQTFSVEDDKHEL